VVEVKRSSEGRRDRLIPLLSQAILEAQAVARRFPAPVVPLAVVGAGHVSLSVAGKLQQFAAHNAPEVAVGVIDADGLRVFSGHGLEVLNAQPSRPVRHGVASAARLPQMFSDLNQWMLKILLGQSLPESLLSVPRGSFRNAAQLAEAAKVSVMSAFRLVKQLANEGFLDEREDCLRIVRVDELLARWLAANRQSAQVIPARWIIKGDQNQLRAAVAEYAAGQTAVPPVKSKRRGGRIIKASPRCCVGLFAAADALGLGFVHGAQPQIYLERLDRDVLRQAGLSVEGVDRQADAYIRIPVNKEAVFRAAVLRDGLPVSDVLQVWLDVSNHPARGREQANMIRKRALGPVFRKRGR
jgi:hypothetical protein